MNVQIHKSNKLKVKYRLCGRDHAKQDYVGWKGPGLLKLTF